MWLRVLRRAIPALCLALLAGGCADPDRSKLYSDLSANLQAKGHLRLDSAPEDAPFTAADLARNFQHIAFSYEFQLRAGRIVPGPIDKPLSRWQGQIRYRLLGDGVTAADRAEVAALFRRLAPLTGLAFHPTDGQADLLITIATPQDRKRISRYLRARGMRAYAERYDAWRRSPGWTCGATMSVSSDAPNRLTHAHIFLGAEAGRTIRTACLHEEIVQALGLTNDHPDARPSIFNDDQEFALMTEHDAILLRALYDPRLRPGMSADQAMPIARRIFAELLPAGSARLARSPQ